MSLDQTINDHLKEAMIQKDQVKLGTLRMLKSAAKNQAIELKKEVLDDEEFTAIIRKELKKRQDSITSYEAGNRQDLADKEKAEAEILEAYLPAMMAEEEVAKIIDKIISSGEKNFGIVMKNVMAETKGQADGKVVQRLVKEKLDT